MDRSTQLIFKYITQIEKSKDLTKVLILLSDMAKELINSDRCTLWLYDKDSNTFWTKVAHGLEEKIEVPADKGIIGLVKKDHQSIIINDPYNHSAFNPEIDHKTGYKTRNIVVVPAKNLKDELIGVYQAVNKLEGEFNETDINFLKLVEGYSTEMIENALLYEEIEQTQREIIFRMGDIAETKSKETGNHIKRVAEYTRLLSTEYGLPKDEVDLITLASPMHDVGKIAIPDSILNKPGKLTFEEFEVMKTHSEIGYNLLKFSSRRLLKAASIIAYEHHEKWNGKGYPQALAGESIHIYGRILALADVFDALVSDRCYKKAWGIDKVYKLFQEEREQHFDPVLTDLFIKDFDKFVSIKDKYLDQFTYEELQIAK